MRLQIQTTPNTEPVPFNYLYRLTGVLHKWLGQNKVHDGTSLYSFGWPKGRMEKGALNFPKGACFNISFYAESLEKQLVNGIMQDQSLFAGMRVIGVQEQQTPSFGKLQWFKTDRSVILAREERAEKGKEYLLWDNPKADEVLTKILQWKMEVADLESKHRDVKVRFDRNYLNPRTRLMSIKGIKHKGSECPIWVQGTPEAVEFSWLVGVGHLSGSGFGALV